MRVALCALLVACGPAAPRTTLLVPPPSASAAPAASAALPAREARGRVRVHFEGAVQVPVSALAAAVEIDKPGKSAGASNREVLERDQLLVSAVLYDFGFVQAKVREPIVEVADDGAVEVTFRIEEGARFRLTKLEVRETDDAGRAVAPLATMRRAKAGDWFSRKALADDLADVRRAYHDAGYAFVEADPETAIDAAARTIELVVPIKRGPVVSYGKVDVRPEALRAIVRPALTRAGVVPGARYSETNLERVKRELSAQAVEVAIATVQPPGAKDRVDVVFEGP